MARMFLTVLRESKKDLRRVPEDFILALSRPIGLAFTWVAEGDPDLMTNNDLFAIPDDLYSDLDPSSADLTYSDPDDDSDNDFSDDDDEDSDDED